MSRERVLIAYCLLVGGIGWLWLFNSGGFQLFDGFVLLFCLLALVIDCFGFRVPPADPHSLTGVVLATAALALGPEKSALVAALEGLAFGILLPFLYNRPRSLYLLAARPVLRSGLRATAMLAGAAFARALLGDPLNQILLLFCLMLCYAVVMQLGRAGREYLQGGRSGVLIWWRTAWRSALSVEVAPMPVAALGAAVYTRLGLSYFALASIGLLATSVAVRRAALNLQIQRRSVRELALLNEVSRAIIRSELDVEALCDLIYREASKIVDTSSFHLGLFDGVHYTLVVRVQDRVRLPQLTVNLEARDGIVGWLRDTGRALLVEDFLEEMAHLPARPRYQSEHPPRSGIYVPLIAGDTVIGSISIQSYRPGAFNADDLRLLSLIADQAAVAIARARAFAEANQRARQLQAIHAVSERITAILDMDELLPSIVRLIREYFGYQPVHIFMVDELDSSAAFRLRASTADATSVERIRSKRLHLGEGIVGAAAQDRSPIVVDDVSADPRYLNADPHTRSELAVPLKVGEQIIGVLDVQSDQVQDFDADDMFVMRTLADQIAIAIDSANSYTAQQEEAWTLNTLLQIAENVGSASTLEDLLPAIVRLPPLLLGCQRCYCLVWERERLSFVPLAAYGLTLEQRATFLGQPLPTEAIPLMRQLAEMGGSPAPIVINNAQTRVERCPQIIERFGSGTLVVLPLTARANLLGALLLDFAAPDAQFEPRQMALFSGIANQIAGALESALLALEAAEAARLEQELHVARDIQTALLPANTPYIPGWEIAADWRSARLVGGDFYDFWMLPLRETEDGGRGTGDGRLRTENQELRTENQELRTENQELRTENREPRNDNTRLGSVGLAPVPNRLSPIPQSLGFVIADVSDKGVPAAMFMALSRSLVRAAALDGSSPALALERANRWITRDSESGMFVTLFYGVLDTDTGVLNYTCAGHNPPLLYRAIDGSIITLSTPGIAMGVLEEVTLGQAQLTMEPGDVLLCYTDGVTEAINAAEEQYGVPRLRTVLTTHHSEGADAVLRAITDDVSLFTSGQPPFDDVTLVVIRRE